MRRTPLRTRKPLRRRMRLHTVRQARVPDPVRTKLWDRCHGLCEACGKALNPYLWHVNHRLLRSQGGTDDLCCLTALHPGCHVLTPWSVHQRPQWACDRGLILHSWQHPAAEPLILPAEIVMAAGLRGDRVLLTSDGTYREVAA